MVTFKYWKIEVVGYKTMIFEFRLEHNN